MDISLNSSVIFAVIIGLWLVWVSPYFLRRSGAAARLRTDTATQLVPASAGAAAGFQRSIMEITSSVSPAAPSGDSSRTSTTSSTPAASTAPRPAALRRIRYGRLSLAVLGLILLAAAVVSAPFALAGMLTGAVPTLALLSGTAAAAVLRGQAVRERRAQATRRAEALARRRADQARRRLKEESAKSVPAREAKDEPLPFDAPPFDALPFDALPFDARHRRKPEPGTTPLTAAELREAALAVAAAAGDLPAADSPAAPGPAWKPVDLPRPTYVEAPKAERPAPQPLELPEAPRPSVKTSIRQDAAAAAAASAGAASAGAASAAPLTAAPTVTGMAMKPAADSRPNTGRINLDDVLQRRRA